jgi:hypothetical protein
MLGTKSLLAILVAVSFLGVVLDRRAGAQAREGKAPTAADRRETAGWLRYDYGGTVFRYPPGWKIAPILWQSAAQEESGEGPDEIGLTISPEGGPPGAITIGGRGASCTHEQADCKCLGIYDAVYTCDQDPQTRHIYDLFITTIRTEYQQSDFTVAFPAAQATLRPNRRYTLRWRTKAGTPHYNVDISVHDTSKPDWRQAMVLDVKDVPNTGRYDWLVPASITSPGPYLLEISFVVPQKVKPPALSGGRIYSGTSSPFYIQ